MGRLAFAAWDRRGHFDGFVPPGVTGRHEKAPSRYMFGLDRRCREEGRGAELGGAV